MVCIRCILPPMSRRAERTLGTVAISYSVSRIGASPKFSPIPGFWDAGAPVIARVSAFLSLAGVVINKD